MSKSLIFAVVLAFAIAPFAGQAQTKSAGDGTVFQAVLNGEYGPASLELKDLPAGMSAVEITVNGIAGLQDLYGSGYGGLGRGIPGFNPGDQQKFVDYLGTYWTDGKTIRIRDQEYLVAYRASFPLASFETLADTAAASDQQQPRENPFTKLTLHLKLLAVGSFVSFAPRNDLTIIGFQELIKKVNWNPDGGGGSRTAAISNMKQLALGAIMYSSDTDDVLPNAHSISQAKNEIMPYVKNSAIFKTQNPNGGQVLYNTNLAGVSDPGIDVPASVPLFYDSVAWPDGGRPVAFCDGHAKYLSADEWKGAAAQLQRKFKRAAAVAPVKAGSKPKKNVTHK